MFMKTNKGGLMQRFKRVFLALFWLLIGSLVPLSIDPAGRKMLGSFFLNKEAWLATAVMVILTGLFTFFCSKWEAKQPPPPHCPSCGQQLPKKQEVWKFKKGLNKMLEQHKLHKVPEAAPFLLFHVRLDNCIAIVIQLLSS